MALLPVEDALARLLNDATPVAETEMIPLSLARGRVLGRDLAAKRTQPPFSASAMDGYAVRAADITAIPAELTVIGQSAAGHGFSGSVGEGRAVRIFTGAPLPEGADTVVIQENVERLEGERIRIVEATAKGRHIRAEGLDFSESQRLLHAGERLDAGRLMLAAAMNHPLLPVLRQPVVALLATGDELVPPGGDPEPDQIIASNSYGVAAVVEEAGGRVVDLGIAGDSLAAIQTAVEEAGEADILVTLGGASVGDHDLVQAALTALGLTLDFWKIAMRPGKPLMFGRLGSRRVLGLPGNPVSTLVCAHLFLRPLVARLAGRAEPETARRAVLGSPVAANDGRQDHLRARLTRRDDGQWIATPFEKQDSSMVRTFA
ncbi:MAG TPA: gephyrin-like molybdotransferase Glp, partial [Pararhizobium sp.]|nr:gephyrin-like molybdotransferase Glp [Pararhizobium sp.]